MTISASQVPYGVSGEGQWGFRHQDGLWMEVSLRGSPSLVTVVQEEPEEFFERLGAGLHAAGLNPTLAQAFPVELAVQMGLTWNSAFWEARALRWVSPGEAHRYAAELHHLTLHGRTRAVRDEARRLLRHAASGTTNVSF
ncbi:hypothetical protein ACFSC4_09925 [Deinococcus malanensis]|uniref:hypothetical protein n=1 Tax=Deinococcus malanensis TaxID=1706855 RepID=UPI0036377120